MEIRIKSGTDVPIYQQIVDAVQEQISSGVLAEGQKLPTVRQLAEEMGLAKGQSNAPMTSWNAAAPFA